MGKLKIPRGMSKEQFELREKRRKAVLSSRHYLEDRYFTVGDIASLMSRPKRNYYMDTDTAKRICDGLYEIGAVNREMVNGRLQYSRPKRHRVQEAWTPDNGIPLGRYFPSCA